MTSLAPCLSHQHSADNPVTVAHVTVTVVGDLHKKQNSRQRKTKTDITEGVAAEGSLMLCCVFLKRVNRSTPSNARGNQPRGGRMKKHRREENVGRNSILVQHSRHAARGGAQEAGGVLGE